MSELKTLDVVVKEAGRHADNGYLLGIKDCFREAGIHGLDVPDGIRRYLIKRCNLVSIEKSMNSARERLRAHDSKMANYNLEEAKRYADQVGGIECIRTRIRIGLFYFSALKSLLLGRCEA